MSGENKTKTSKKRGPFRRTVRIVSVLVILVFVFALALPTLVSMGLGQGWVIGAIKEHVNGDVAIDSLSVGWFSVQSAEGVRIVSSDGSASITASADIDRGLLSLLFNQNDLTVHVHDVDAQGVRYADGSTSFAKLLPLKSDREKDAKKRDRTERERAVGTSPHITLELADIHAELVDETTSESITIRELFGSIEYRERGETTIDLTAITLADDTPGMLRATGSYSLPARGRATLEAKDIVTNLHLSIESLPVGLVDALLNQNGRLVNLLGETVDGATLHTNGSLADGTINMELISPRAAVRAGLETRDGVLHVSDVQPIEVSLQASNALLESIFDAVLLGQLGWTARPVILERDGSNEFTMTARIDQLDLPIPLDGTLAFAGVPMTGSVASEGARLRMPEQSGINIIDLRRISGSIRAADLTGALSIDFASESTIDDHAPGSMRATLTSRQLLTSEGAIFFDPANIDGEVHFKSFATAIAQPFLADTPVILVRDIGPIIDLDATFSAGDTRDIALTAQSANFRAQVDASVTADGGITGKLLDVSATLHGNLMSDLLVEQSYAVPSSLHVSSKGFRLPARTADGPFDLRAISGDVQVTLDGAIIERRIAGLLPIEIDDARLSFSSPALGEQVSMSGTIRAHDATVVIAESVTGLFDENGSMQPFRANADGTISIDNITEQFVASIAPDQQELFSLLAQSALKIDIHTTTDDEIGMQALLTLSSSGLSGLVNVTRASSGLWINSVGLEMRNITRDLLRTLQEGRESPVLLSTERMGVKSSSPIMLAALTDDGLDFQSEFVFDGAFTFREGLIKNGPVVPQPYQLRNVQGKIKATIGEKIAYSVDGTTTLRDRTTLEQFSDLAFSYVGSSENTDSRGSLYFSKLNVPVLEQVWEKPAGTIATWTGDQGDLRLESTMGATVTTARADIAFPFVSGAFDISQTADFITVTANEPKVTVQAGTIEMLLNPVQEGPAEATPQARITVAGDVPMTVTIRSLAVPRALLSGAPVGKDVQPKIDFTLDPAESITVRRTGSDDASVQEATFSNISITTMLTDLAEGAQVAVRGGLKTRAGEADATRTRLDINVVASNLLDDSGAFSASNPTLDTDVTLKSIPSWVVDAFAGRTSVVQDAFGDTIDLQITSRGFSAESGRLNGSVSSANKSTLSARLSGRGGLIRTQRNEPTEGSLTLSRSLRDRLLYKIHPVFADIRSMKEQIRFTVSDARFSPDNDLSKLDADIHIEVGEIELDSGSQLLWALSLTQAGARDVYPGYIGPIDVKIRKGVVAYDNFEVKIGGTHGDYKHTLAFAGQIDLVKSEVRSLTAAYPVAGAKKSIKELAILPDNATFGLKFFGNLYNAQGVSIPLKWEPIINFKPEDFLKGGLEDLLRQIGDGE